MELGSIGLGLVCWTGRRQFKGLAVAARPDFKLVARQVEGVEWAIQGVSEGDLRFGIVGIWACAPTREERYVRQIHGLLDRGTIEGLPERSIVIGDFNSNSRWDYKHNTRSHSRLVERFDQAGFQSAYHSFSGEPHGGESRPTFFLQRSLAKPYHIDYGFLSSKWLGELKAVEVGDPADWLTLSDHMPFSVELG